MVLNHSFSVFSLFSNPHRPSNVKKSLKLESFSIDFMRDEPRHTFKGVPLIGMEIVRGLAGHCARAARLNRKEHGARRVSEREMKRNRKTRHRRDIILR